MAEVESLGDYRIYRVWSDSAPEIQAGRAREIATEFSIKLEPTGVHCPQAGGKHESGAHEPKGVDPQTTGRNAH